MFFLCLNIFLMTLMISFLYSNVQTNQAQKKEEERKEEEMAEKIKASFRASEAQKTEWVHCDMAAQL